MISVTSDNTSVTNSVTATLKNSHCIICGNAFQTARTSKLYCSPKCKQYGYNHKEKISSLLPNTINGINQKPQSFYIDDFTLFDKRAKRVKRYRELKRKESSRDSKVSEINLRQRIGLSVSDYTWNSYASNQLTENEEGEIYDIESEVDEEILSIKLEEVSLEEWSFIKSLYPQLDELSFYRTISSLGHEFLRELNLRPLNPKERSEHSLIKNKFINHCNLIAEGKIMFISKPKGNEKEANN